MHNCYQRPGILKSGYGAEMDILAKDMLIRDVDWEVARAPVPYAEALARMEARADAVRTGAERELIWLLEHPEIITAGTRATDEALLQPGRFPLERTGRGGQLTYHGPGQRIIYAILDLGRRGADVRRYVAGLEQWGIAALGECGVAARRSPAGTGIWVEGAGGEEAKIGAIGVRVRRWVSLHGMAINVTTDLSGFDAIVPCGIAGAAATRLADLCPEASLDMLDRALRRHFGAFLGYLGSRPGADA
jgi:lipoyl(octanoyl) transferase